jgi:hypothetical protein
MVSCGTSPDTSRIDCLESEEGASKGGVWGQESGRARRRSGPACGAARSQPAQCGRPAPAATAAAAARPRTCRPCRR